MKMSLTHCAMACGWHQPKAKEAAHPGVELQRIMTERSLTAERLLTKMNLSAADFDLLLKQQLSVNESIARELARALGKTSKHWLELQNAYDLYEKQKKEAEEAKQFKI